MLMCPYCNYEIQMRKLSHQGLFKTHRICPNCDGSFTPDPDTKKRQAIFIIILIISLIFTLLLYFRNIEWLIPFRQDEDLADLIVLSLAILALQANLVTSFQGPQITKNLTVDIVMAIQDGVAGLAQRG